MTVGQLITQLSGRRADAEVLIFDAGTSDTLPVKRLAQSPTLPLQAVLIPEAKS